MPIDFSPLNNNNPSQGVVSGIFDAVQKGLDRQQKQRAADQNYSAQQTANANEATKNENTNQYQQGQNVIGAANAGANQQTAQAATTNAANLGQFQQGQLANTAQANQTQQQVADTDQQYKGGLNQIAQGRLNLDGSRDMADVARKQQQQDFQQGIDRQKMNNAQASADFTQQTQKMLGTAKTTEDFQNIYNRMGMFDKSIDMSNYEKYTLPLLGAKFKNSAADLANQGDQLNMLAYQHWLGQRMSANAAITDPTMKSNDLAQVTDQSDQIRPGMGQLLKSMPNDAARTRHLYNVVINGYNTIQGAFANPNLNPDLTQAAAGATSKDNQYTNGTFFADGSRASMYGLAPPANNEAGQNAYNTNTQKRMNDTTSSINSDIQKSQDREQYISQLIPLAQQGGFGPSSQFNEGLQKFGVMTGLGKKPSPFQVADMIREQAVQDNLPTGRVATEVYKQLKTSDIGKTWTTESLQLLKRVQEENTNYQLEKSNAIQGSFNRYQNDSQANNDWIQQRRRIDAENQAQQQGSTASIQPPQKQQASPQRLSPQQVQEMIKGLQSNGS